MRVEGGIIVGMKASSTDLYHFDQIMQHVGPSLGASSGQDTLFLQQLASGMAGGVLTSAGRMSGGWAPVQAGKADEALALQRRLGRLMGALSAEESPGPLRHALELIEADTGESALPTPPLSDALKQRLARVVAALRDSGMALPEAA
ncbi:dihydrodipicolinate synthase family protein [Salipiger bermudensis]|uniref:dihydrodipicolinate synthase family protein n=1 Tax=Salipiger bermudensis TaxID=344736 RepID=UPI00300B9361